MVAIRRNILRKTITYMLIGALTVTSLTSIYTQSVFAEEESRDTSDNPYKGNPDNVFDLMKNSWFYTVTQLGFFVNDMCTFDLSSIGVGACQNKMDYEAWLTGHNMTADDVVESYDASTGTVNLSINYVKNVYNDVLDAVQEDEGWYWSNGKNLKSVFNKFNPSVTSQLNELSKNAVSIVYVPRGYNYVVSGGSFFFIYNNYFYLKSATMKLYKKNDQQNHIYNNGYYDGDLKIYDNEFKETYCTYIYSSDYDYFLGYTDAKYQIRKTISPYFQCSRVSSSQPYYGYTNKTEIENSDEFYINNFVYGSKRKIYTSLKSLQKAVNGGELLIYSLNEQFTNISIKLDDLNRDWLKVNNEIKDLIDDYMKDFQDYTEKQDKIDAAISSTLATMNENLAAGKEDLIGAIKESAAVQQLWLERIYNKEVEIYTKYLEENEQTQAVLVGIANQLKEYFEASLKNQGNYLTYEQFAAYAQQIIDAINNSGGSSGTGTEGSTVDMSTVDEYIKKIYEKEVNLYDELQAISKKLDNINDNLTKYLWNTDKSIPFLADIANLIKEGFEKCTAPLSVISEKLDELIGYAKKILNMISIHNLIDTIDRTKSEDEEENASLLDLITCVLYAVLILGSLCDLFLKMLEYVILMFQIPATPALFNEYPEILQGWEYAASFKIPNTDFGIIQFLRLLLYITLIFVVVKVIRRAINNGSIDVIGK